MCERVGDPWSVVRKVRAVEPALVPHSPHIPPCARHDPPVDGCVVFALEHDGSRSSLRIGSVACDSVESEARLPPR